MTPDGRAGVDPKTTFGEPPIMLDVNLATDS
jgi:hypothetical protein